MSLKNNSTLELYQRMVKIRLTEEAIVQNYSDWEMRCPTHLSIGQEAIASGVCGNLQDCDFVMSTHRCHAHYIAKGGDLNSMIAEIYGKSTGCSSGKGGSMHLIDTSVGFMGSTAIVGNTIPLSVGLGLSIQLKTDNNISCVFFGDGAVEEGVFYESVNFAILKSLPVLFICENNLYSVYSPLNVRQPQGRDIHQMVKAMGIKTEFGDGNDVIEVFEKTSEAVKRIKEGQGPQFLEFSTYRWREHCGPNYDNDIGYRTEEEYERWKAQDPIDRYKMNHPEIDNELIDKINSEIQNEVSLAFDFAKKSPFPDKNETYEHLFSD